MSDAPVPSSSPPDSAAVPPHPDAVGAPALAPLPDAASAVEEPERNLEWALANPGEALRSVPLHQWVFGSVMAAAALQGGVEIDAKLADEYWITLTAVFVNGIWRVAAGTRAPDPLEWGEERWVEMDQPPIRPFFRVLAAAVGLLMTLVSLSAGLDVVREGDWDMLLMFLTSGAMGGLFLYMAVMGGRKAHVLLPPVPHPAYLQRGPTPSALHAGDAPPASASVPEEAREHVPAPRDV